MEFSQIKIRPLGLLRNHGDSRPHYWTLTISPSILVSHTNQQVTIRQHLEEQTPFTIRKQVTCIRQLWV